MRMTTVLEGCPQEADHGNILMLGQGENEKLRTVDSSSLLGDRYSNQALSISSEMALEVMNNQTVMQPRAGLLHS